MTRTKVAITLTAHIGQMSTSETSPTGGPVQKHELTAERVLSLMQYVPETGLFIRLKNAGHEVKLTQAGCIRSNGYRIIEIDGFQYLAHRLAWLVTHGSWPIADVAHKDGDRDNNRIENLCPSSATHRGQSRTQAKTGTVSGLLGVSWSESHKKWRASIMANGHSPFLGRYDTKEQAYAAYLSAKEKLHSLQPISSS